MMYGLQWLLYIVKDVVLAPGEGKSLPEPKSSKPSVLNVSTQAPDLGKALHSLFETLAIDSTGFVLTSNQLLESKTVVRAAACAEPAPARPSGSKLITTNLTNLETGRPLQVLSQAVLLMTMGCKVNARSE
jgi:hypothetical protein